MERIEFTNTHPPQTRRTHPPTPASSRDHPGFVKNVRGILPIIDSILADHTRAKDRQRRHLSIGGYLRYAGSRRVKAGGRHFTMRPNPGAGAAERPQLRLSWRQSPPQTPPQGSPVSITPQRFGRRRKSHNRGCLTQAATMRPPADQERLSPSGSIEPRIDRYEREVPPPLKPVSAQSTPL